jgi:DNA-binding transcriptional ArsR family regulator
VLDYDGVGGMAVHTREYPILRGLVHAETGSDKDHLWVRTPAPVAYQAIRLPDGSKLEVFGNKHIVVCPPSLHPSGKPYRWKRPPWDGIPLLDLAAIGITPKVASSAPAGTPIEVGEALSVNEIDAIVGLVTPAYSEGQKHTLVLALAGWLASQGVPEADANTIVAALAEAGDNTRDLARAVSDTYRKAAAGLAIAGWARLTDRYDPLLPPAAIKRLDLVLRRRHPILDLVPRAPTLIVPELATPPSFDGGITLAELQRTVFAPLNWIVGDILPEGAALLAGKAKSKKSWLGLNISLNVAGPSGRVLGRTVLPGRVLYLDLEGNQRRIQSRVRSMLGHRAIPWPDRFHLFTEWPSGALGLAHLRAWLEQHGDTRLIVIDVFADFRGPTDPKANMYEADREISKALNKLAEEFHCAILLVHHTRKMKADDVFDEISGTTGLQSGVGTMWVLSRMADGVHTQLSLRGRDLVDDEPLALSWNVLECVHEVGGSVAELALTQERQAVLNALADDEARTVKDIASMVGTTVPAMRMLLSRMLQAGLIDRVDPGKYARIAKAQ